MENYFLNLNFQVCNSLNNFFLNCFLKRYVEFFSEDVPPSCRDKCPLECESITYDLSTSSSEYPSPIYGDILKDNPIIQAKFSGNLSQITYESLKRNMVQISVFYGDLGYDQYEEQAKMDITDLVSNIGGTLGLFLGMSFLSFVEFIDILLQIFLYKKTQSTTINVISPS